MRFVTPSCRGYWAVCLLFGLLGLVGPVTGQITYQQADLAAVGDTVFRAVDTAASGDSLNQPVPTGGSGVVWNYDFPSIDRFDTLVLAAHTGTPGQPFSKANVRMAGRNETRYYQDTAGALRFNGLTATLAGLLAVELDYTPHQEFLQFPFSYQDAWYTQANFDSSIAVSALPPAVQSQLAGLADSVRIRRDVVGRDSVMGEGTLVFNQVDSLAGALLLENARVTTDSLFLFSTVFGGWALLPPVIPGIDPVTQDTVVEYHWFSPNYNWSVLRLAPDSTRRRFNYAGYVAPSRIQQPGNLISGPTTYSAPDSLSLRLPNRMGAVQVDWNVLNGTVLTTNGDSTRLDLFYPNGSPQNDTVVVTLTFADGTTRRDTHYLGSACSPLPSTRSLSFSPTNPQAGDTVTACLTPNTTNPVQWTTAVPVVGPTNGTCIDFVADQGAGSYPLRAVELQPNGCPYTPVEDSVQVVCPTLALTGLASPDTTTNQDTLGLRVSGPTGLSYTWTFTSGQPLGPSNQDSLSLRNLQPGLLILTVHGTNAGGCTSDTLSDTVFVDNTCPPLSMVSLTTPDTLTNGDTVTLRAVGPTGVTLNWTVTGGTILGAPVGDSIRVSQFSGNSLQVAVFGAQPNGPCTTDTLTDTVPIVQPCPTFTPLNLAGPTSLFVTATNVSFDAGSNNTGTSFQWTATNAQLAGPATSDSLTVASWDSAGTSTLTVVETYPNNCGSDSAGLVVTLTCPDTFTLAAPNPAAISGPADTVYSLAALSPRTNSTYHWGYRPAQDFTFLDSIGAGVELQIGETTGEVFFMETTAQGCDLDTVVVLVNTTVTNRPDPNLQGLAVYPNPTSDYILVEGELAEQLGGELEINLIDEQGRTVYHHEQAVEGFLFQHRVPVVELPQGVYFLQVATPTSSGVRTVLVR